MAGRAQSAHSVHCHGQQRLVRLQRGSVRQRRLSATLARGSGRFTDASPPDTAAMQRIRRLHAARRARAAARHPAASLAFAPEEVPPKGGEPAAQAAQAGGVRAASAGGVRVVARSYRRAIACMDVGGTPDRRGQARLGLMTLERASNPDRRMRFGAAWTPSTTDDPRSPAASCASSFEDAASVAGSVRLTAFQGDLISAKAVFAAVFEPPMDGNGENASTRMLPPEAAAVASQERLAHGAAPMPQSADHAAALASAVKAIQLSRARRTKWALCAADPPRQGPLGLLQGNRQWQEARTAALAHMREAVRLPRQARL